MHGHAHCRGPWLLLFTALLPALAAAAASGQEESLDQVVVEGGRVKLSAMLKELAEIEDTFFERYNDLNTNDDFDVYCAMETRAGTLIRRRSCRAVYMSNALESEGMEYALFLRNNTSPTAGPPGTVPTPPPVRGNPPPPSLLAIEGRRKEYQQNLIEVVRRNPELAELLQDHNDLLKQYEALRRKAFRKKPPTQEELEVFATPAQP